MIIISPSGKMETLKSDIFNNGKPDLMPLGFLLACICQQRLLRRLLRAIPCRCLPKSHHTLRGSLFHLYKNTIASYPEDGERLRDVVVADAVADPASQVAKQLRDLLTGLKRTIATAIANEKHSADPSEHLGCRGCVPSTANWMIA